MRALASVTVHKRVLDTAVAIAVRHACEKVKPTIAEKLKSDVFVRAEQQMKKLLRDFVSSGRKLTVSAGST